MRKLIRRLQVTVNVSGFEGEGATMSAEENETLNILKENTVNQNINHN